MDDLMRENRLRGSNAFPFILYEMPCNGQPVCAACHWQEDMEILLINSGKVELTLGGAPSILCAGAVVCINPGQLHSFRGLTPDAQCDIFLFPLQHLLFVQEDHDQLRYLRPLAEGKMGFPLFLPEGSMAEQIIRQVVTLHRERPSAYEIETKALLLQLILQLIRADILVTLRPAKDGDICKKILTYVHQHYAEKLTVPDVAAAVGISPTYFSTFFVQHFFQHFSEYLRSYRIEQACVMLVNTSMAVTDVALAAGFCSGSHFIRHFKDARGMTPFAYRKMYEREGKVSENSFKQIVTHA
ncbi:MAG: AraC family transcriptional regulator [Lachnospiraceae bacterium]|nr:AraC family transcriptional regulator [Lachnospiraceae bacterium]